MLLTTTEWLAIASRLLDLTDSRRIEWSGEVDEKDSSEDSGMVFRTSVRETIYLLGSVDSDGSFPYYLEVWDKAVLYDRVVSPTSNRTGAEDMVALRGALGNLYKGAYRSFYRAPEKAARLVADLEALSE
jgi:hypothetical protein